MNEAISQLNHEFDLQINEFTVFGHRHLNHFAHTWWIGTEKEVDANMVKEKLDIILISLNDDYKTERSAALSEVFVNTLPNEQFYAWMESQNKLGGSHKFPRVLNAIQHESWSEFLKNSVISYS